MDPFRVIIRRREDPRVFSPFFFFFFFFFLGFVDIRFFLRLQTPLNPSRHQNLRTTLQVKQQINTLFGPSNKHTLFGQLDVLVRALLQSIVRKVRLG